MRDIAPVLVTGATGMVGSRIVRALLEAQVPVRALIRTDPRASEPVTSSSPRALPESPLLEVRQGDLSRRFAVAGWMEGCSGCIHAAGHASWVATERAAVFRDTLEATGHVVDAAFKVGLPYLLTFPHPLAHDAGPLANLSRNQTPADLLPVDFAQAARLAWLEVHRARGRGLAGADLQAGFLLSAQGDASEFLSDPLRRAHRLGGSRGLRLAGGEGAFPWSSLESLIDRVVAWVRADGHPGEGAGSGPVPMETWRWTFAGALEGSDRRRGPEAASDIGRSRGNLLTALERISGPVAGWEAVAAKLPFRRGQGLFLSRDWCWPGCEWRVGPALKGVTGSHT